MALYDSDKPLPANTLSKKTGLSRRNTYYILSELEEKGIVVRLNGSQPVRYSLSTIGLQYLKKNMPFITALEYAETILSAMIYLSFIFILFLIYASYMSPSLLRVMAYSPPIIFIATAIAVQILVIEPIKKNLRTKK